MRDGIHFNHVFCAPTGGRASIGWKVEGRNIKAAVSICHPKDQFTKSIARAKLEHRLEKEPVVFTPEALLASFIKYGYHDGLFHPIHLAEALAGCGLEIFPIDVIDAIIFSYFMEIFEKNRKLYKD